MQAIISSYRFSNHCCNTLKKTTLKAFLIFFLNKMILPPFSVRLHCSISINSKFSWIVYKTIDIIIWQINRNRQDFFRPFPIRLSNWQKISERLDLSVHNQTILIDSNRNPIKKLQLTTVYYKQNIARNSPKSG